MKAVLTLVGLVLLAVGPAALLAPDAAASAFGIPLDSPSSRAYLIAAGTRDVALGVWLLALLWLRARSRELAISVLAIALVAAGDATNVVLYGGTVSAAAIMVHLGGLVVLLFLGWRLWRSRVD